MTATPSSTATFGLTRRIVKLRNETFMPDGNVPGKGDVFRNPDLARTYETLGKKGRDAFYRGRIAKTIDKYMKRHGGFLVGRGERRLYASSQSRC